jgi:hypothetical protein
MAKTLSICSREIPSRIRIVETVFGVLTRMCHLNRFKLHKPALFAEDHKWNQSTAKSLDFLKNEDYAAGTRFAPLAAERIEREAERT